MNFIQFLKSIFIYSIKSRWLFVLIFFVACLILFFDLAGHTGIRIKRETLWTPIYEHYVAFGTFIVAFAAWFSTVKRDWREGLPKRLTVEFTYKDKIVMQCHYAYLSGESDIRQMAQQTGAQMAGGSRLNFKIVDIVWKEQNIIYHVDQIFNGEKAFFENKLPFRHYTVHFELFSLPEDESKNNLIEENYKYIWSPPFDINVVDEQDKKKKLQYNKKQPIEKHESPIMIVIDLSTFFKETAKLEKLADYKSQAIHLAGEGNDITLTGAAPVWLYLTIAHALHGKAKKLIYTSPVTGEVVIFDHNPF